MDQDKKNTTGAPSSDTTSALFVSARKKQLEQQEAEQRAKEKEEQRLAAEAEVRRLEAEVEERRRKAAEEAKRVELEAAEQKRRAEEDARRIAEEARLKKAQAAENPDAVLGAPPQKKEIRMPQMPKHPNREPGAAPQPKPVVNGDHPVSLLKNKKLLAIIGGGLAAAVILVVVLALALGGGGKPVTASGLDFGGVWYMVYSDGDFDTYTFLDKGKITIDFYDGESESGTYKVSGEDINCKISDMDLIFTTDGYSLYESVFDVTLTRELVNSEDEPDGDDIIGKYVYSGDESGEYLIFDGYESVRTSDDSIGGIYSIEGDTVTVTLTDGDEIAALTLTIQDEDTLIDEETGDYFVRVSEAAGGSAESEGPMNIDPDSDLNASAVIDGLGMIVKYPNTVFWESQLTDGRLILVSADGYATVEASKGNAIDQATDEDMQEYRDKVLNSMSISLPREVTLIDSGLSNSDNAYTFVYFKLSYDKDGEARYLCWTADLWRNERTGDISYSEFLLDCPESLNEDYMALFNRIRAAKDDA